MRLKIVGEIVTEKQRGYLVLSPLSPPSLSVIICNFFGTNKLSVFKEYRPLVGNIHITVFR